MRSLVFLPISCLVVLLASGLTGCSEKDGKEICEKAAAKYIQCVEQIVGQEMADQARATRKEGTAACAKDEKTQAMYTVCLPKQDCEAFMNCLTDYAKKTAPRPAAGASRAEQCAYHVRTGLRGIGIQLVMFAEDRDDDSKRKARSCVLDDSKVVESCLNEKEKETLGKYAQQRQKDCESWEPELAACILGLEGAKNCNPDEYPFWREPIIEGAAGPPIAWTIETKEREYQETWMKWLGDGTLVVLDATGLRAVRDGKKLWQTETKDRDLIVVGKRLATRASEGGLVIREAKTGKQKAMLLGDKEILAIAPAAKDRLLVLDNEGKLFRVDPATCKGATKKCVKPDGSLLEDDVPDEPRLAELDGGVLVVASNYAARFLDKKRKLWFSMKMGDNNEIEFFSVAGKRHVAITDAMGVALLDPDECVKGGKRLYLPHAAYVKKSLGYRAGGPPEDCDECRRPPDGCVVSYRGTVNGDWEKPIPIGDGVVAFNDHGLIEKTHLLDSDGGWEMKTGGHGEVAGDENHVYTISFGQDGEGPVSILALARDTGNTVWQTKTPDGRNDTDEYTDTTVAVRGKWLAAHIGTRIYVMDLQNVEKKKESE